MSISKYKLVYNPVSDSFQYVTDPGTIVSAPASPGRIGNIPIFGENNQMLDSGFYLNEQGEIVKVEGGYFA